MKSKFLILLSLLFLQGSPLFAKADLCSVLIKLVRSTQPGLGKREANHDFKKMKDAGLFEPGHEDDLRAYQKRKFVKFVRGPANLIFIVDGNHHAFAYQKGGVKTVLGQELADFSNLPRKEFWKKMYEQGYVYRYSSIKGNEETFDELWAEQYFEMLERTPIKKLEDIPFRSIVGLLYDEGVIRAPKPLRFYWQFDEARKLHNAIILLPGKKGFKRALDEAREFYSKSK